MRDGQRILTYRSKTGDLDLLLPPGDYALESYGWDPGIHRGEESSEFLNTAPTRRQFTISADQKSLDMEPIDVAPARLSRLIGQKAPELGEMQAWKNGGPVSLESLRGKVVLIDFWSWGCQPCLASMPKLIELHERFEGRGVVILAIHDDSAATFAEVDEHCASAKARIWGRRELPFLLAIDSPAAREDASVPLVPGKTAADYGIQALPTLLLIDKQGVLRGPVARESVDDIATLIEKLLTDS
jgi:thiol-disulfide isomerase/thioredoxin